jgi:hypothetical protein
MPSKRSNHARRTPIPPSSLIHVHTDKTEFSLGILYHRSNQYPRPVPSRPIPSSPTSLPSGVRVRVHEKIKLLLPGEDSPPPPTASQHDIPRNSEPATSGGRGTRVSPLAPLPSLYRFYLFQGATPRCNLACCSWVFATEVSGGIPPKRQSPSSCRSDEQGESNPKLSAQPDLT